MATPTLRPFLKKMDRTARSLLDFGAQAKLMEYETWQWDFATALRGLLAFYESPERLFSHAVTIQLLKDLLEAVDMRL